MNNEVTVLIADDHPIFRRGLRQIIEADPGLKIVAEAEDGEQALGQMQKLPPQVAVLNVDMPRNDGIEVARQVRASALITKQRCVWRCGGGVDSAAHRFSQQFVAATTAACSIASRAGYCLKGTTAPGRSHPHSTRRARDIR